MRTFGGAGLAAICGLSGLFPLSAGAQGVIKGSVRQDATNRPLGGVEVVLEGTKKSTVTDGEGQFLLTDLPTGNRVVLFRFIGYRPLRLRVILSKTDTVRAEAIMVPEHVQLEPLEVTARPNAPRGLGVESFEARRQLGFGKFLDSTQLRRFNNRRMGDVLRGLGGIRLEEYREMKPGGAWGPLELRAASILIGGCYLSVIYDGVTIYMARSLGQPPDFLREFQPSTLQAVEVYRTGAETPLEFGGAGSECGVIVLWSRRK